MHKERSLLEEELRYEEREIETLEDDGNPLHPEEAEDEQ